MRVLTNVVHAISSVFGCQHDRLSRPFTIKSQSYMVCLECGRKLFYSTDEMRRLSRREVRHLRAVSSAAALQPVPAAAAARLHAEASDPTLAA